MQTHVQYTLMILQHEPDNLKREIPQITQTIINKNLHREFFAIVCFII